MTFMAIRSLQLVVELYCSIMRSVSSLFLDKLLETLFSITLFTSLKGKETLETPLNVAIRSPKYI